jgi:hypothetical protein
VTDELEGLAERGRAIFERLRAGPPVADAADERPPAPVESPAAEIAAVPTTDPTAVADMADTPDTADTTVVEAAPPVPNLPAFDVPGLADAVAEVTR